jgi:hypothetical protein
MIDKLLDWLLPAMVVVAILIFLGTIYNHGAH